MEKRFLLMAIFSFVIQWSFGQEASQEELLKLETEDIMSLPLEKSSATEIVSASKKAEKLFDAPLSATVISKEEIRRAGCTSIMEAIRLVPGAIVKEQTNGNYDIHLRGMDNVPPNTPYPQSVSTTMLVMIDGRAVYNYFSGGTMWETLPIDINDVERIEVIRGPAAALYGPNAVTGVINIITKNLRREGAFVNTNTMAGSNNTVIANSSAGYRFKNGLSILATTNIQQRDRTTDQYYNMVMQEYDNLDSIRTFYERTDIDVFNAWDYFPEPSMAMDKFGLNLHSDYEINKNLNFELSTGWQNSESQKIFGENRATSVGGASSSTGYVDFKANWQGLSFQGSFLGGDQYLGSVEYVTFNTRDLNLEYDLQLGRLNLTPGLSYRHAFYGENEAASSRDALFQGNVHIYNYAASIRSDLKISDKLRFIGGLRADKFTDPSDIYLSWQLTMNYKPTENQIITLNYSRANRSPFIINTYIDLYYNMQTVDSLTRITQSITGDKNARLLTNDMIELGYRYRINKYAIVKLEAFQNYTRNFVDLILQNFQEPFLNENTGTFDITLPIVYENVSAKARQMGLTLSGDFIMGNLHFKPYVTYQHTRILNYSPFLNTPDAPPAQGNNDPENQNIFTTSDFDHVGTPAWFGGAYLNYMLTPKININLNPYFFSNHTFKHYYNATINDGSTGVFDIDQKLILNARISYRPVKQFIFYINVRNLLEQQQAEFGGGDPISRQIYGGVEFTL